MLKKFGLEDSKPTKTPMSIEIKLTKDDEADSVDSSKYEGLDELEKTLEQIEPYYSRLPALDDIRNLIHRRTIHEKIDKEGNTIYKLPNQIKTSELFDHLRPCELLIRENIYFAIGNRDHTQAVIAFMLYCLENRQPFNLAYFIVRRIYFFRDRRDKVLPYGMILTRLFENLKANIAQGSFNERYKLVPRKMSLLKALEDNPNMSKEQRETRGMFKNLGSELGSELTLLAGSELKTIELDTSELKTSEYRFLKIFILASYEQELCKENGVNILKSIDEGPFQMGTFRETLAEGTEGALHLGQE
ncbi:hypothetical protein Tco_1553868 [Tanacetum coccineum]